MTNELDAILSLLGPNKTLVEDTDGLLEIIMDLDRPLLLRYSEYVEEITDCIITAKDLNYALSRVTSFGTDNRAGINGTLHRISRIIGRDGQTVLGLTCRVGRAIEGQERIIQDLLDQGHSILVIGAPGKGKTTMLRSASKYLSDIKHQRVVIIDSSDEIAGSGNVPHPAVGSSRKMPVPFNKSQHDVLIEAVENHYPTVIVIDEISDIKEAESIRTISKRGVAVLGTCHGNTLEDVMENQRLRLLVGGVKDFTIGDKKASTMPGQFIDNKTIKVRQDEPAFTAVVEILSFDEIRVYTDLSTIIDKKLRGAVVVPELRQMVKGRVVVKQQQIVSKKDRQ